MLISLTSKYFLTQILVTGTWWGSLHKVPRGSSTRSHVSSERHSHRNLRTPFLFLSFDSKKNIRHGCSEFLEIFEFNFQLQDQSPMTGSELKMFIGENWSYRCREWKRRELKMFMGKILIPHSGGYEYCCLMGCDWV